MEKKEQDKANIDAILSKEFTGIELTFIEKNILNIRRKRARNAKKNITQNYMKRYKNTKK